MYCFKRDFVGRIGLNSLCCSSPVKMTGCVFFLCLLKFVLGSVQFPVFFLFGLHHINRISASAEICFSLATRLFLDYFVYLRHTSSTQKPTAAHPLSLSDTQGTGWYVLSKTRRTTRETAGIPIWSPLDSCSACAVSAQRCRLTSTDSSPLRI